MANDLNQCMFVGRLGDSVKTAYTAEGKAVANISLAVGSQWKDKVTGEKKESVEWVKVVSFGKLAEIMSEYLTKGSQVLIVGSMRTRKWQDQNGQDRYTTEIVADKMQMLGGGKASGDAPASNQAHQASGDFQAPEDFDDSQIPF